LKLSKDGEIIIKTGLGELKLSKPVAWQEKDGKKLPVEVSYKLIGKNRYSFVVAKADPSLPIVIDPILQSTYLGGSHEDSAYALAIHPQTGEVYVAGYTWSINFPGTTGGAQSGNRGSVDVFVARLSADLRNLHQATYLGGSGIEIACTLAIHPRTGEVYVAGITYSTDFSGASGGAQASNRGGGDAFVARLNSSLTQILQSTYLGGSGYDRAVALAIHPRTGEVYVAGITDSTNFPNTTGGAQASNRGGVDAFVARLSADLRSLHQSTYLGGSHIDNAYAITIHPDNDEVYAAGITYSTDFSGASGGAQASNRGGGDAFVARLNSSLTQILQSTYLGGSGYDRAVALAIHPETGEVYVAGETYSDNFPGTSGSAQPTFGGRFDVFVARLRPDLQAGALLKATYLGGSDGDEVHALAIHPRTGEVYVAGGTYSTNFPGTSGRAQASYVGNWDAFAARLNKNLTQILQSTYLGGSGYDRAVALAIHPRTGEVYVAGITDSTNFPNTSGGAQANSGGRTDAFVARLTADLAAGSGSGGGGGGCSMTGSASSMAGFWNILVWLSVPAFALVRRIRKK
jgi:hypothetical protein